LQEEAFFQSSQELSRLAGDYQQLCGRLQAAWGDTVSQRLNAIRERLSRGIDEDVVSAVFSVLIESFLAGSMTAESIANVIGQMVELVAAAAAPGQVVTDLDRLTALVQRMVRSDGLHGSLPGSASRGSGLVREGSGIETGEGGPRANRS
jgi:hypothetical protein